MKKNTDDIEIDEDVEFNMFRRIRKLEKMNLSLNKKKNDYDMVKIIEGIMQEELQNSGIIK